MVLNRDERIIQKTGYWEKYKAKVEVFFDEKERHRYQLNATWDEELPNCLYIMLNPSTADHIKPDPTLKKCIGFATRNKYGSMSIVNLYSYRATDPEDLWDSDELHHSENEHFLKVAIHEADRVIVAWGKHGARFDACKPVLAYLRECGKPAYCIGTNGDDTPKHPGRPSYRNPLVEYIW